MFAKTLAAGFAMCCLLLAAQSDTLHGKTLPSVSASQPAAAAADANTHEGVVISASGTTLVMSTDGKEHSHTVPASVQVTVNGKPGKLEDFKRGMRVRVMTDKDGNVLAVSTLDAKKG
jgi:hypothetical protein